MSATADPTLTHSPFCAAYGAPLVGDQDVYERLCMNCGRPQGHRIHTGVGVRHADDGRLANGCHYSFVQPETLWSAVLWPAIVSAAEAHGAGWEQAHQAVWDHMRRP